MQQPIQSPPQLQSSHYQGQFYPSPQFNPTFGAVHRMQQQSFMNQGHFNAPPQVRPVRPVTSTESGAMAKQENVKRKPNDPLGFDVFADFKKEGAIKPNSTGQTSEPNLDAKDNVGTLLDINIDGDVITNHGTLTFLLYYSSSTFGTFATVVDKIRISYGNRCGKSYVFGFYTPIFLARHA